VTPTEKRKRRLRRRSQRAMASLYEDARARARQAVCFWRETADGALERIEDIVEGGMYLAQADRRVARTRIEDVEVSTVFLGLDMMHGLGPESQFYETMIFAPEESGLRPCWRYPTRAAALAGHREVVAQLEAEMGASGEEA
jgi:hypothetical protein